MVLQRVFIALNCSVTIVGKVWMVLMVFLRLSVLLLAGYPLYQDEQEKFVCNTIQPGCANVCYDIFAPLSLFRFWLVQLTSICLPLVVFLVYVSHKVISHLTVLPEKIEVFAEPYQKALLLKPVSVGHFTGAYIFHLLFRILLEAGFGAAHYHFFGFHIPRNFICQQAPCTTMVDCYISRPTEKTIMLNFMLGMAALSLLINLCDLICAIKQSVKRKSKKKLVEKMYEEDRYLLAETDMQSGDFGKPKNPANSNFRKGISKVYKEDVSLHMEGNIIPVAPCGETPLGIGSGVPGLLTGNQTDNYIGSQDEAAEHDGNEVALYMYEHIGTPRSVRVNKRSRLKPLPPPRKDAPKPGTLDVATPIPGSTKRTGQFKLPELNKESDLLSNGEEGHEKRSAWV